MVAGSFAAPVLAWRALSSGSDRPYAIVALILGSIDALFVTFVIAASLIS